MQFVDFGFRKENAFWVDCDEAVTDVMIRLGNVIL
jgi:hypothetical protein